MKKLAPFFAATMLALSGAALAQDDASPAPSDPSAQPDAQGQEAQPKAFVLIQRNIYVPVDSQGNVASQNWIVIDKQGVITAEELEKAAKEAGSETTEGEGDGSSPPTTPSAQSRPAGEGPVVRS